MVVKANTKAAKVLEESKKQLENIDYCTANETEEVYSSKDYKKDLAIVYSQTGFELVKTYGPGVTLVLGSVACILGAHNIMRKRNVALIAAYKLVEQGFAEYRSRVVEELGTEADLRFRHGTSDGWLYHNNIKPRDEE
jgi:precorrin-6B methylase 1